MSQFPECYLVMNGGKSTYKQQCKPSLFSSPSLSRSGHPGRAQRARRLLVGVQYLQMFAVFICQSFPWLYHRSSDGGCRHQGTDICPISQHTTRPPQNLKNGLCDQISISTKLTSGHDDFFLLSEHLKQFCKSTQCRLPDLEKICLACHIQVTYM